MKTISKIEKIRDDLKHVHNIAEQRRVKDFVAGMILDINEELIKEKKQTREEFLLEQIGLSADYS